jgi:hypothetical protein
MKNDNDERVVYTSWMKSSLETLANEIHPLVEKNSGCLPIPSMGCSPCDLALLL